jgi:hypothetical protein
MSASTLKEELQTHANEIQQIIEKTSKTSRHGLVGPMLEDFKR